MKLIFCPKCHDVVNLRINHHRKCWCGASGGKYIDNLNAVIDGEAIPLGFNNFSFLDALEQQPETGPGKEFTAFIIEKNCPTINQASSKNKFQPNDYEQMLDNLGLTKNQSKLLYALCMETSQHPHSKAYVAKHNLKASSIGAGLKFLQRFNLICKTTRHGWRIKDMEIAEWLHNRLSSRPTDESDLMWSIYFERSQASVFRAAVRSFGEESKARVWLNSPCHELCDHIPQQMLN